VASIVSINEKRRNIEMKYRQSGISAKNWRPCRVAKKPAASAWREEENGGEEMK